MASRRKSVRVWLRHAGLASAWMWTAYAVNLRAIRERKPRLPYCYSQYLSIEFIVDLVVLLLLLLTRYLSFASLIVNTDHVHG
jgi:hypothetical protein